MSERTLICVANEPESNGLKLSVKVTPVLFSNVKVEFAPEAAVRPALMTMPSVKHDIVVKTTTALLNIFFLYIDRDRKSTRLNSSHLGISYAVFCLKKKIN